MRRRRKPKAYYPPSRCADNGAPRRDVEPMRKWREVQVERLALLRDGQLFSQTGTL